MKVLVTGGSGFLGTHIGRFFEADDLSRRSGRSVLNLHDVKVVGDYDVVIHMAALLDKSSSNAESVFLTNVEGTINVLREMRKGSVFIFASTKDVYSRFADNYQLVPETCPTFFAGQSGLEWSKLIAERYVEFFAARNDFRSCIFRMSSIYAPLTEGNVPNFVTAYADAINKGEPIRLPGNGNARRDILHVDDFSRACKAFVDSVVRNGLYNIGGGSVNAVTLNGLVEALEEASGYQAIVSKEAGPVPIPQNYVSDLSMITHELDWKPEIGMKEGLATLF